MTKIALVLALTACLLPAQGEEEAAPRTVTKEDEPAQDERLSLGDLRKVSLDATGHDVQVTVTMARPLSEGFYTCVHVLIDCDDNAATGMRDLAPGRELWVRAAVGSRFVHNGAETKQATRPLDLLRASYSTIYGSKTVGGPARATWLHRGELPPPTIDGETIRFSFPKDLATPYKSDYHSRVALRVDVETCNADQPLLVEKACDDEGLAITVDGKDGEWSGSPFRSDKGGELHDAVRFCDLLHFSVDHDADNLYAAVRLDKAGLDADFGLTGDVQRKDSVIIQIEPMSGDYGPPRRFEIPCGKTGGRLGGGTWALSDRCIELAMPRASGDSRFRALAWGNARRWDFAPNSGSIKMEFGR